MFSTLYRDKLFEMKQARGETKDPNAEEDFEYKLDLPDFSESYSDFFPQKKKRKR